MEPFKFVRVQDAHTAISEASAAGSKFLAGGTNILDLMKLYIERPRQLIDINALKLDHIEVMPNGNIRIGALVKNTDLAYYPEIIRRYPVLSEAVLSGASAQLRNMATTAGNMLQRTRCYYFYDAAFPCNKRQPGSGCSAIPGYNRIHAILGTSDKCIATHPSDMSVAMAALDAIVHIEGPKGTRTVPFTEFHLLPGETPQYENVLRQGDLITAVEIPNLPFATHSHYLKVRDRQSYEFALASAAVALDIQGGTIRNARIALGGVGTKPWRSFAAEKALIGASASTGSFQKAAEVALSGAKPQKYNAFKVELAKRTLVRALNTVGGLS